MKRFIWLVAFVTVFAAPHAFADREVVREESGIVVEEESTPGRTLPILTGTTTMSAPPEQDRRVDRCHSHLCRLDAQLRRGSGCEGERTARSSDTIASHHPGRFRIETSYCAPFAMTNPTARFGFSS